MKCMPNNKVKVEMTLAEGGDMQCGMAQTGILKCECGDTVICYIHLWTFCISSVFQNAFFQVGNNYIFKQIGTCLSMSLCFLQEGLETITEETEPKAADADRSRTTGKTHKSLWRNLLRGEPRMLLSPKTGKERIRASSLGFVRGPPPLKAFPCQQPAEPQSLLPSRCWKVRGFLQLLPLSNALALLYLLQFGCQAFFKHTSLILLCGTSGIRRLKKKRNTEFRSWGCHMQRPNQRESLFFVVFQQT